MRCKCWMLAGNALLLRLARNNNKKLCFPCGFQTRGMRIFASTTTILLYPLLNYSVCSPAKLHLISFSNSQLDLARSSHPLSDDREDCKQKNQGTAALHWLFVSVEFTANTFPSRVVPDEGVRGCDSDTSPWLCKRTSMHFTAYKRPNSRLSNNQCKCPGTASST